MQDDRPDGDLPTGVAVPGPGGALSVEDLPRGASLGRYLVVQRIGAGGMGTVYSAYDPQLNRRLAVGDPEWVLIDQHRIYIGMTECALLASWGKPEKMDHDNTLRSGGLLRYIYHDGADLVYVADGKITSFQKAN